MGVDGAAHTKLKKDGIDEWDGETVNLSTAGCIYRAESLLERGAASKRRRHRDCYGGDPEMSRCIEASTPAAFLAGEVLCADTCFAAQQPRQ